jgi:hypothetical protein
LGRVKIKTDFRKVVQEAIKNQVLRVTAGKFTERWNSFKEWLSDNTPESPNARSSRAIEPPTATRVIGSRNLFDLDSIQSETVATFDTNYLSFKLHSRPVIIADHAFDHIAVFEDRFSNWVQFPEQ